MSGGCGMRVAGGLVAFVLVCGPQLSGELGSFRESLPTPAFHLESVSDDAEQLECQFSDAELELLEKLNRIDRNRLTELGKIVIPDRWDLPETAYSPLPQWFTWAAYFPKAIVVSKELQAFGAFEEGRLISWGPVSTGAKKSATPNGLFHLNWRSKSHRSTVNRSWLLNWYFNFNNERGHSFHEYELPGLPVSHSCVRMLRRDAYWLYEWGDSWELDERGWNIERAGTPVLVLGAYVHSDPKPWLQPNSVDLESVELPGEALDLVAAVLLARANEITPMETNGTELELSVDWTSPPSEIADLALYPWTLAPHRLTTAESLVKALSIFTDAMSVEPLRPFR